MTPWAIKMAISRARTTQSAIARGLGVSTAAVSDVVNDRGRSRRIASEISRIAGRSLDDLWPGVYTDPQPAPGLGGFLAAGSQAHRVRIAAAIERERQSPLRFWSRTFQELQK
jgi:hypothetical protein